MVMSLYNFIIYAKTDFDEIDFNGDIVTQSVITPIIVTVEDNDTHLSGLPGTYWQDTNGQQTIVASSDPSLVGLPIRINNPNPVSNTAAFSDANGYYRIQDIAIDESADYVMYLENGVNVEMTPSTTYTDTQAVGSNGINYSAATPVCFTAGTRITTPSGQVPVERLAVGDLVVTLDRGPQPVRWITGRRLDRTELEARPNLYPIRIRAGAIGKGLPHRDLLVSPQHRILVRSKIAERVFGTGEVLMPAKKLLGLPGVEVDESVGHVIYYHFICDRHEIVLAENCPSETLYPGPEMQKMLDPKSLEELRAILPDALEEAGAWPRARPFARGPKMKSLLARHMKNQKPLFQL